MASNDLLAFVDKENPGSTASARNKSLLLSSERVESVGSKKKGLGVRKDNGNQLSGQIMTPRKALGDVKNVQQMLHPKSSFSIEKTAKIPPKPVSSEGNQATGKSSIFSATNRELSVIPEAKKIEQTESSDSEDEIEQMHVPPKEIDTFDDILGPVKQRISSIPVTAWNKLLEPPRICVDILRAPSLSFLDISSDSDDWTIPKEEFENQKNVSDEESSLENLFMDN